MSATLVGSKIRTRREALGVKQRDVARRAGISASYLNLIEHNRRGIAGKVLINIAKVLDVEVSRLLEGADGEGVRRLQDAAARDPEAGAELVRTQEFLGRFPGWARLAAGLEQRAARLERRVDDLSDRLAHDPFLADSLHEILSSVTAIHATSGILVEAQALEPLQRRRFEANIHEESARLSHLSRALVTHFNPAARADETPATPLDEVEAFLKVNDFQFADLDLPAEGGKKPETLASEVLSRAPARALSPDARGIANALLKQLAKDSRALPLSSFSEGVHALGVDPLALARRFDVPPAQVMRRLAFLPNTAELPHVGLISCDATGAVLLRKPIAGFPLPRYGSACALWPLYQAMSRPHVPLKTDLVTSEGRRFQSYAFSAYMDNAALTPVLRATMMLYEAKGQTAEKTAPVHVGQSCRICEIEKCPARREPSIHASAL